MELHRYGFDTHEKGATDLVKEILVLKPEGRLTAQQVFALAFKFRETLLHAKSEKY